MDNRRLLHDAIAAVTSKGEFPFDDASRIMEDVGLDSTSAMEVLMELEDRSALEIDPNELDVMDFQTVGSFVRFLDRSLSATPT
ncbi:acyl carrier protein [Clavibacter michiganensis]|uniref:Acyl carrier protein n=1 Tax=Clavibacter michiganensis TaxID=28447 RepID=A0A251YEG6_9MICO|nr:phosphopantetheine-binding protein [Clavibacter michiganensis]OUE22645.1 acyl carrier protein [Clavibacter michiganensis]